MSNTIKAVVHSTGYVEVDNGRFTKKISIKDYSTVIQGLVAQEDQAIANSTTRYPSSIHSVTRTNQGFVINLYYDAREASISHTTSGSHMVYMPNVMIRVQLFDIQGKPGEYSLGDIHWFCTDKGRTSLPTHWPTGSNSRDHIWTLPLPNMFGSAQMCTGGNRLPSVVYSDWTILDMLYHDVLLRSPFNNDLTPMGWEEHRNAAQLVTYLGEQYLDENTEGFPYDELVNY